MTTNYTVPPNFGELVRAERMIRGWTMIDLQNRSGIHVNTISRIERGITKKPQRATAMVLAIHTEILVNTYVRTDGEGMRIYDWLSPDPANPAQGKAL